MSKWLTKMASSVLGSMWNFRSAIIDEAPQSMRYRLSVASSKKQALYRPPLPKASPDPKNLTCIALPLLDHLAMLGHFSAFDDIVTGQNVHTQMCEDESLRRDRTR